MSADRVEHPVAADVLASCLDIALKVSKRFGMQGRHPSIEAALTIVQSIDRNGEEIAQAIGLATGQLVAAINDATGVAEKARAERRTHTRQMLNVLKSLTENLKCLSGIEDAINDPANLRQFLWDIEGAIKDLDATLAKLAK